MGIIIKKELPYRRLVLSPKSLREIPYHRPAYQAVLSPVGPIAGIPIAGFR